MLSWAIHFFGYNNLSRTETVVMEWVWYLDRIVLIGRFSFPTGTSLFPLQLMFCIIYVHHKIFFSNTVYSFSCTLQQGLYGVLSLRLFLPFYILCLFYTTLSFYSYYFPVLTRKNFVLGRQGCSLLFYQFPSIQPGVFLEIRNNLSFLRSFHTEFLELNINDNKTLENFNDPKWCS